MIESEKVEIKAIKMNRSRGLLCLTGLFFSTLAASFAWGINVALFVLFFSIFVSCVLDEFVERVTLLRRVE